MIIYLASFVPLTQVFHELAKIDKPEACPFLLLNSCATVYQDSEKDSGHTLI